jgi:hypothetical protein
MQIRSPELTNEQIATWMRQAATRSASKQATGRTSSDLRSYPDHPGFDFKKAKQALNRARAKTAADTIKPFRWLRRNQEAVNEALINSCGALVAVNKQMASEIAALSADMAALRQQLAERESLLTSDPTNGQL